MKERRLEIGLKGVAEGIGARLMRPIDGIFQRAAHHLVIHMVSYILEDVVAKLEKRRLERLQVARENAEDIQTNKIMPGLLD